MAPYAGAHGQPKLECMGLKHIKKTKDTEFGIRWESVGRSEELGSEYNQNILCKILKKLKTKIIIIK